MKTVCFTQPQAPVQALQKSTMDEVDALARQMHNLDIGDINYSSCYMQLVCLFPTAANALAAP
jgi:hypothetical protein